MSITLDAHATFMVAGSFRKDSRRRYDLATRICLTFMIKVVPERQKKRKKEKERKREKVVITSANGTYNGFKFYLSIFMVSKYALA